MEIKKLLCLSFIFFLSFTLHSEESKRTLDQSVFVDELAKNDTFLSNNTNQYSLKEILLNNKKEIYLLPDSIVILDKFNLFKDAEGFSKYGNFLYATDPNAIKKYKNKLEVFELSKDKFLLSELEAISNKSLKIAFEKNNPNQKFITNGRLIVEFSNLNSIIGFDLEYDIKEIYNQYPIMVYEANNLDEINNIISNINNDPRVKSLDLDKVAKEINLR